MSIPSKRILVLGATGVVGKVLTNSLLNAGPAFDHIGIFTSAESAASKSALLDEFRSRGAEVIVGDLFSEEDVLNAYKHYDTVVSAVGRFAIDKQIDLIATAERSPSIVRFIPSEFGTDVAYNATSALEKPHQKKLKVRAFLESSAVQRLKYTYIVTGPIADLYAGDMSSEPRMGSFSVAKKEATLLGDGKGKINLTTMGDCGRLLVAVLRNPQYCDNKAVFVNSFTTTPEEILAEMERQTETRWKIDYTSLEDLKTFEAQAWKEEKPLASIYTLRRIWTQGLTLYDKMDNEAIGVAKTDTLEMVVQEAVKSPVAAFQSGKL
ncbi:hypothetical protein S40288_09054 [Stachybotrys chartarum IBT 40288]|nr:hypothetical protein S40288_09054 [Stachybotrys chartarum IBT 40288]